MIEGYQVSNCSARGVDRSTPESCCAPQPSKVHQFHIFTPRNSQFRTTPLRYLRATSQARRLCQEWTCIMTPWQG